MKLLVDDRDSHLLSEYKWKFIKNGDYVRVATVIKGKTTYLSRMIMKAPKDMFVDHINNNPLDNRRDNLRICTNAQNTYNVRKGKNNTSGYKGVVWAKWANKWRAYLKYNYKTIPLGYFSTKEEAALAYNEKAKELHGEFANLNMVGGEIYA